MAADKTAAPAPAKKPAKPAGSDIAGPIGELTKAVRALKGSIVTLAAKIEALAGGASGKDGGSVDKPTDKAAPSPAKTPEAAKPAAAAPAAKKPAAAKPGAKKPEGAKPAAAPKAARADAISVAIVGARSHGAKHIDNFLDQPDCVISHICDVDSRVGSEAVEKVFKAKGYKPKFVQDFRELIKDPALQCVSIAMPHHWHALATVWALRAGKHVYLEKPVTHSFSEGPVIMAAARKYGKVVQAGTQLRSNMSLAEAGKYMRDGKLGKIELVHCITYKNRPPLPLSNENVVPATVDYDLWCGPAGAGELGRSKFHYHWHWFWQYGNGALGNNGIHRIDAARIALDLKGYGDLVFTFGGRFGPFDGGETPNTQFTIHKFGDVWLLQDIMGMQPTAFRGITNGVLFYGTEGTIVYQKGFATLVDKDGKNVMQFEGKQLNHYRNFLDAVKSDGKRDVRGDLEESIISSDLCHFGNISYRVGKKSTEDDVTDLLNELAVPRMVHERFAAMQANMDKNGVKESLTLGAVLRLRDTDDPIIDNAKASALLQGKYREPFVLPDANNV
ncbi:MAG: Gfo/Idh/MocA family oxidoreductase [Rhizobiaceae bacterium]|nr:Gfo/Idh/MocA family oxidoreductase [Rhizobiaceae bacterium]